MLDLALLDEPVAHFETTIRGESIRFGYREADHPEILGARHRMGRVGVKFNQLGRQMGAIERELKAGEIDEDEAGERRLSVDVVIEEADLLPIFEFLDRVILTVEGIKDHDAWAGVAKEQRTRILRLIPEEHAWGFVNAVLSYEALTEAEGNG